MKRTLVLRRDTLTVLGDAELMEVGGADGITDALTQPTICEQRHCISKFISCFYC